MTLPNGPYLYRVNGIGRPIIVEIYAGHVCEAGEDHIRPLSMYTLANFVALVEAPDMPLDVSELEAHWPAIPDLQGGLDLDGEYPIAGEARTDEDFAAELDAYCDAKEANANDQPS